MVVNIKCGWCGVDIKIEEAIGKHGYGTLVCPNCARSLPSSKITKFDESAGRKHSHRPYKEGDVAL